MPDLTVQEVAALAKVSAQCVRNWCRRGLIPGAWNAGSGSSQMWRVPPEGWEKFRAARQQAPVAPPSSGRPARIGPRVPIPDFPNYFE